MTVVRLTPAGKLWEMRKKIVELLFDASRMATMKGWPITADEMEQLAKKIKDLESER